MTDSPSAQRLNRAGAAAVPPPAMSVPPPPPVPRAAFECIHSATILRPGDRVLVECDRGARQSDIDPLLRQLKECFPGVVFFVMVGAKVAMASGPDVEDVVVKPAEEEH